MSKKPTIDKKENGKGIGYHNHSSPLLEFIKGSFEETNPERLKIRNFLRIATSNIPDLKRVQELRGSYVR